MSETKKGKSNERRESRTEYKITVKQMTTNCLVLFSFPFKKKIKINNKICAFTKEKKKQKGLMKKSKRRGKKNPTKRCKNNNIKYKI